MPTINGRLADAEKAVKRIDAMRKNTLTMDMSLIRPEDKERFLEINDRRLRDGMASLSDDDVRYGARVEAYVFEEMRARANVK